MKRFPYRRLAVLSLVWMGIGVTQAQYDPHGNPHDDAASARTAPYTACEASPYAIDPYAYRPFHEPYGRSDFRDDSRRARRYEPRSAWDENGGYAGDPRPNDDWDRVEPYASHPPNPYQDRHYDPYAEQEYGRRPSDTRSRHSWRTEAERQYGSRLNPAPFPYGFYGGYLPAYPGPGIGAYHQAPYRALPSYPYPFYPGYGPPHYGSIPGVADPRYPGGFGGF